MALGTHARRLSNCSSTSLFAALEEDFWEDPDDPDNPWTKDAAGNKVLKVASEYARVWLHDNLIADRDELEQLRRKWIQVFASATGHTHWQQATCMLTGIFIPVWVLSFFEWAAVPGWQNQRQDAHSAGRIRDSRRVRGRGRRD